MANSFAGYISLVWLSQSFRTCNSFPQALLTFQGFHWEVSCHSGRFSSMYDLFFMLAVFNILSVWLEPLAHQCTIQETPFCLSLSPDPTHSKRLRTKERDQTAQFCILVTIAASSPDAASQLNSCLHKYLLVILGQKPSLWQINYHPSPTAYKISLFLLGRLTSLVCNSGTWEPVPEWALALFNIPVVILLQFGWIWLTISVGKHYFNFYIY